ncbi:MAG: phosphoenolpyruvate carboxylase, partial [Gemmatimonadetes bacterium]|nr:phosphoenolpyruvate carboxylase [Gemmatimonadota bacterium]
VLTGWYGAAAGLEAAVKEHGREEVMAAIAQWPFLSGLLSDVETDLASADLEIASAYARLTGQDTHPIFRQIEKAHEQTVQIILELKCADELLEHDDVLRRSIRLRNPYIDPISLLQVDLLRQWRAGDHQDDDLLGLLVGTVHGISQGLQNTG